MARSLVLMAARGLDRSQDAVEIADPKIVQMTSALPAGDEAVILLRGPAIATLQRRAGYIPEIDPRPLEANYEMQNMTFPWSKHFSHKIAKTVENSFSVRDVHLNVSNLERYADLFKWSLHTSQNERILAAYEKRTHSWPDAVP